MEATSKDSTVAPPTAPVRFERDVAAVAKHVAAVRHDLTEFTRALGLDEEQRNAVRLAVTEAMSNAVVHAFVGREPGRIHVLAEPDIGRLEVRVADNGRGMGPRADSPGLGMGLPLIGKICTTVDLGPGPGGAGTEVRMVFTVPGLRPAVDGGSELLEEVMAALARSSAQESFIGSGIVGLADLFVPRLCDLCSISLVDDDGAARRISARVARPDGSLDDAAAAWVMDFPLTAPASPSALAAVTGRTRIARVDREFADAVSPDARRAEELLALGMEWWAAVPLRSAGRPVGSIAIAGRTGHAPAAVAIAERVAEQAGALVATSRLVGDLRRGRDRLQRILESLGEAVTVRDEDGQLLYANAAAAALHGPALQTPLPDGLTEDTDTATGARRFLEARSTRLEEGLVVTVTQDVTAAREAELIHEQTARMGADLQTSLSRLQLLIDAGFGGLIRGAGSDILAANQTFLEMVGYPDVESLPPWPQMTPPEWGQVDAEALRQMRERGKSDLFEKEYLRRDGTRVPVLIAVAVTDQEAFEWIGVVVDMSARRSSDAQAQSGLGDLSLDVPSTDERREVADVLGGLAAAVLIQRPGAGIIYANQAAAEAMGMGSPQEVIAASPEEIATGWDTFEEDGTPLVADRYPSRRILNGERDVPPLVVRTINRRTGREFWRRIQARGVLDDDGQLRIVVSMTEDITQERRAVLTQRLLADAGRVLSTSPDHRQTLRDLVRLPVPELADWCSVEMPDDHGRIRTVAVAHNDPAKVRLAWDLEARYAPALAGDSGSAQILRGGAATLFASIPERLQRAAVTDPHRLELLRAATLRSAIQAPIVAAKGQPIGVLNLVNDESGREFTEADLALAEELGRRMGTAIQNTILHAERAEIAATLQRSLLPGALPRIAGYELEYEYRPAGEHNWVGGDFLDVFAVGDGWFMIVGDVAGHGAQAAALTARARHTLRAIGESTADPVAAVTHLNRLLLADEAPAFVTVCALHLREEASGATAQIVCAGHPLPFLVRDGRTEEVGRPGLLLGAQETTFTATPVALRDGDTLTIYTDGIPDTRRGHDRFGVHRLTRILAAAEGAADTVGRIRAALEEFRRGPQTDDTALLALHRLRR